jgi:hypothetical protein
MERRVGLMLHVWIKLLQLHQRKNELHTPFLCYLHTMVFFVADVDEPKGVCCYARRVVESARRCALDPECSQDTA